MDSASTPRTPSVLVAELYVALLPLGHLLYVQVAGAWTTASDLLLLPLLAVTALEFFVSAERGEALVAAFRGGHPGLPGRHYLLGILALVAFAGWVALSGTWGFHTRYAVIKGLGVGTLALGAGAVAVSGIGWRRAADAWLVGAALSLGMTLVFGLFGPDVLRERVLYQGGGVLGLPFPRISGPLVHPNMMGDYLVVTGVILWGRWPELSGLSRRWAGVLGVAVACGLFLTASTAWIAAGVGMMLVGRRMARKEGGVLSGALRAGGVVLAGAVLVATIVPLDLGVAGLGITTSGIRPQIWRDALAAVVESPLLGVGAAPFLAEAVDPLDPAAGVGLWDAHNAYLSVWGQFGLVGVLLAAAGIWGVAGGLAPSGAGEVDGGAATAGQEPTAAAPEDADLLPRGLVTLRMALMVAAVHALFIASEDLRHLWLLVGVMGATEARRRW